MVSIKMVEVIWQNRNVTNELNNGIMYGDVTVIVLHQNSKKRIWIRLLSNRKFRFWEFWTTYWKLCDFRHDYLTFVAVLNQLLRNHFSLPVLFHQHQQHHSCLPLRKRSETMVKRWLPSCWVEKFALSLSLSMYLLLQKCFVPRELYWVWIADRWDGK